MGGARAGEEGPGDGAARPFGGRSGFRPFGLSVSALYRCFVITFAEEVGFGSVG